MCMFNYMTKSTVSFFHYKNKSVIGEEIGTYEKFEPDID